MPKVAAELSALQIKRLAHGGGNSNSTHPVGGVSGLMLQITPNNARSWILRTTVGARRREIGLGGFPEVSLAQAREMARDLKAKIRQGVDPVEERRAAHAALVTEQKRGLTFREAVDKYLSVKLDQFSNEKHKKQWCSTLQTYANPEIGDMLVQDIVVQDVLRVLEPIWTTKTETATRVRGRIESILSWATIAGHRSGDNPARWGGNLKELLPIPSKVSKSSNQPALQLVDASRWYSALRARDGIGSRALEFTALTATRSQEVRGATWDEIDLDAGLWIIPANRMKMDREHRVPLSLDAIGLLKALPRFEGNDLLFPAPRGGPLSDMTLSAAMKRLHATDLAAGGGGFIDRESKRPAVPHGLRSTFRDWVAEKTPYPGDLAEIALAHRIRNAVEAAYRRGDMIEKRRGMMDDWAGFLIGPARSTATLSEMRTS
ncbi:integrase arm-type DNA-binding domain-containing protein [Citreicella sp. C3M06]|uniref:tyrosine-type recombinase/integrase n=1 Tax=Citreicella sp. C3M06 TaxID=2841564 RepID=UPI001C08C927|nr:integrase arm-type DNA-binding domain-containing protein [Citreicella sp. C3M06]MBU2962082.1 integrase arm-type DNA-binding domain-containing protein [Citreicella sp. C3M06]